MRFAVRFLRHQGRVIRWRLVANQPARSATCGSKSGATNELRRYIRAAKLSTDDASRYSATLPELLDVRLISMSPQAFTLTGFERIEGAEYAQSWLVAHPAR